ncbi:pre-mRNA 3'-end-processing factor FIP1 isoform X2 [Frankliniella occidentalis]|uniref:Pre-mRNA 3'-end-processing factor FIP1 isoform X2 n=1 Tax=Frankliniella occidentalis TaxID=133901 RepID=A0A6J1SW76_FRAOC|nr:pre-mRNA 3'-end-processing factor FIP1 isoform X2 [Frankliniella occidentalis]
MADDQNNDDQWLYGDSMAESQDANNDVSDEKKLGKSEHDSDKKGIEELSQPEKGQEQGEDSTTEPASESAADESRTAEETDDKNDGEIDDDDDDDDSDDDVNVVIGDIKTTPATYSSLNIKRGGLLTSAGGIDKLKQPGKFSIEEFEQIGTINGIPTHEYNLDSLEDKPWRKPGADITDYFNYGFNEETWRAYCERQKRMRVHESGVGLGPLGSTSAAAANAPGPTRPGAIPVSITNDNSKYNAALGIRKAGPPPGRKMGGSIDVIGSGGGTLASRRNTDRDTPPKENVIQVMTADRREYSRKNPGFPDMSVPPPTGLPPSFDVPPPIPVPSPFPPQPPPRMHPPPPGPYGQEQFYSPDTDPYYQSYEPTQEQQWLGHESFGPREEPHSGIPGPTSSNLKSKDDKDSPKASRDRDRDRSEREKEKHRSHRHRSRSRSPSERKRRHKSRSRSPNHRSHRKKKSKKSDKTKDEDSD